MPALTTLCSARSAAGCWPGMPVSAYSPACWTLRETLDCSKRAGASARTARTHVLAAVRDLNRIELLAETLRAALNAIAGVAPDWLRALAPPEWHARYARRIGGRAPPRPGPNRAA